MLTVATLLLSAPSLTRNVKLSSAPELAAGIRRPDDGAALALTFARQVAPVKREVCQPPYRYPNTVRT
jgi:hypothetical protein